MNPTLSRLPSTGRVLTNASNAQCRRLIQTATAPEKRIGVGIGKREVVGFGLNGSHSYNDIAYSPFPSIRFREIDSKFAKLREKEKGHWKDLTNAEKKQLYRASFCLSYAEMLAYYPYNRKVVGVVLACLATGIWMTIFVQEFIVPPPRETATDPVIRKKIFDFMVAANISPVFGFTKDYDYENNRWKN